MSSRKKIPKKTILKVLERYEFRCGKCQASGQMEIDHILPLALGGSNEEDNLMPLCVACHRAPGAKTSTDIRMIAKAERQRKHHETGRGRARKGRPFQAWRTFSGQVRKAPKP